jgi:hypothetical protein
VIRDLAVMLADGGECVSDLGAVREQDALFGAVASDSTAFRVIDRIASEPGMLDALRLAHARARERFWEHHGVAKRLTIDVDATLITAHSEKEKAAGNYKGGYGFFPLMVYADETREALGGVLRPGNAGSNTVADHLTVLDLALEQIPARHIENLEILVRADSAGATHGLLDYCREGNLSQAGFDGDCVPSAFALARGVSWRVRRGGTAARCVSARSGWCWSPGVRSRWSRRIWASGPSRCGRGSVARAPMAARRGRG